MKTNLSCAAIAVCLSAAPAWAQLNPPSGWSLGLSMNRVTTTSYFDGAGTTSIVGRADDNASVEGGYDLRLGSSYTLGLGLSMGLGELSASFQRLGVGDLSFQSRDMYALYAAPGYRLGESGLLYGKLAYFGARVEERHLGLSLGRTYAGVGYGLGLRWRFSERLFLQAELLHADYEGLTGDVGALRPMSTSGSIGLGWRF